MTIVYEGCDVHTLHIGSKTLELSLSEIEEIQEFVDGYIEDLEMELRVVKSMLTKDKGEKIR